MGLDVRAHHQWMIHSDPLRSTHPLFHPGPTHPKLSDDMRKALSYVVIGKHFLESIDKNFCVITDYSTFELWGQTKQISSNTLDIV
jgi:hypothetical protein